MSYSKTLMVAGASATAASVNAELTKIETAITTIDSALTALGFTTPANAPFLRTDTADIYPELLRVARTGSPEQFRAGVNSSGIDPFNSIYHENTLKAVWRAFSTYVQLQNADGADLRLLDGGGMTIDGNVVSHAGLAAGSESLAVFAKPVTAGTYAYGATTSGSNLNPAGETSVDTGTTLSGTYRCEGYSTGDATNWRRIA